MSDSIEQGHAAMNEAIWRVAGHPADEPRGDSRGGGSVAGGSSRESKLIGGPSAPPNPEPDLVAEVNENLRAALRRKRGY
jgi:hypothetical protein